MSLEFKIASRYMMSRRSKRRVSLITAIAAGGVTVGVMALIVVMGVMSGLQDELREKILVASPHLRIMTYGEGLRLDNWEAVRDVVLDHPEVVAAQPFVLSQGLLSAGHDFVEGAYVVGLEPDTGQMRVISLAEHFIQGNARFETTREDVDGGIALGSRLAQRLSASPGTRLTVISPAGSRFNSAMGAYVPKYWFFEVTGVFETGMYEYDNSYAAISREVAQEFQGLDDAVSGLEVRLADPWDAPRIGDELVRRLGGYPYRSVDWQSLNSSLFSALQLEKMAMGTILLLIVIVAAFNIVSMLTMVVVNKGREIGILRAMGYPARAVRRVFVMQGVLIGVVGTALGTVLGVLVAYLVDRHHVIGLDPSVYFVDHLPVKVQTFDLVVIAVAGVLVATLATLHPAQRAAALDPVDAIRYE